MEKKIIFKKKTFYVHIKDDERSELKTLKAFISIDASFPRSILINYN